MKIQTVIFFCLAIWMATGFASNCAQFNPNNFKICAVCAEKYYLLNGKCVLCTDTTSTLPECLPKTTSSDKNQSKTNSTNAGTNTTSNTPKTDQPASTNTSSNDTLKNKTSDVDTTKPMENKLTNTETSSKSNVVDSITKNPISQVNSNDSISNSSKTNESSNTANKTTQTNSTSKTTSVTPKTSPLSLIQLLAQSDLVNCAQFAITSEGIVCLSCKQNFTLNVDNLCVPCLPKESNSSANQKTTVNITTNIVATTPNKTINEANKSIEVASSSISSDKTNTKNETVSESKMIVDTKATTTNEVQPKVSNSQTQITPTTFIPPIATNMKSQNNPVTTTTSSENSPVAVQNSIYSTVGQYYSLPFTNNIINTDNSVLQSTSPANNANINQPIIPQQTVKYPIPNKPTDPNCVQPNPAYSIQQPIGAQNKRCLKCYTSYYYNIDQQICSQVNPRCRTADDQNNCLNCYPGYELSKGDCVIGNGQQSLSGILVTTKYPSSSALTSAFFDPNCNKCAPNSNQCILCAVNYYLSNGICRQVNPLCKTYNRDNGNCLSCYQGYTLNTTTQPISCSISSITDCKTYDRNTGNCLTCYTGYYLSDGTCKQISTIRDPYCNRGGSKGCEQCIQRYYPDQNGTCQMVSLLCAHYNQSNGVCLQCILLYTLVNGQCVYQP